MQEIKYQELEQEIKRLTCAMLTRDRSIIQAMMDYLQSQFSIRDVAGIVLVGLERLLWQDAVAFCWAVEQVIPGKIMAEIRQITSLTLYKRLIDKGLQPGRDFSVDRRGNVLLNESAKKVAFP